MIFKNNTQMNLNEIKFLSLPKIVDERGNLTFIEGMKHVPFNIMRTYMIYDVPNGEIRGSHAYKRLDEVIVALSGSFDLIVNDGSEEKLFSLNRSNFAIFVPHGLWRTLSNFSTNSLCLVLASTEYDEEDYIRNFDEYLAHNKNEK